MSDTLSPKLTQWFYGNMGSHAHDMIDDEVIKLLNRFLYLEGRVERLEEKLEKLDEKLDGLFHHFF